MIWPSVSIIIRTLNEANRLRNLLFRLECQRDRYNRKEAGVETIVVDNESADNTVEIARNWGAKVITLKRNDFTFPKSLNVGAAAAANEILIFTVGHALPVSYEWLEAGLRHFASSVVGGVFSQVIPHKSSPFYPKKTLAEILFYYPGYLQARIRGPYIVGKRSMGVLGATNCAIRKSIWEQHHFDERFECGGEDGEMARWIQEHNYQIVCDWQFAVYHSHGMNFRGMREQFRYWSRLGGPTTFNRDKIKFRKDLDFQGP